MSPHQIQAHSFCYLGTAFLAGATLIEVSVALLIFSVTALGLINLQQRALETTQYAVWYNQAVVLAADAVERIRANPTAQASYRGKWQSGSSTACTQASNACSATQLAQADMAQLLVQARIQLPEPQIEVATCGDANCVQITWHNAVIEEACRGDAHEQNCVAMSF